MTDLKELLSILVCPQSKRPLTLAVQAELDTLNREIRKGSLAYQTGEPVLQALDGALIREDRIVAYAIRDGIPILLESEAIVMP